MSSDVRADTALIGFWPVLGFFLLGPLIGVTFTLYSLGYCLKGRGTTPVILWPYAAAFGVINTAHNWIVCTILFREMPREFFTTTRLRRMKGSDDDWRRELADMLGGFLNSQDPGHY